MRSHAQREKVKSKKQNEKVKITFNLKFNKVKKIEKYLPDIGMKLIKVYDPLCIFELFMLKFQRHFYLVN